MTLMTLWTRTTWVRGLCRGPRARAVLALGLVLFVAPGLVLGAAVAYQAGRRAQAATHAGWAALCGLVLLLFAPGVVWTSPCALLVAPDASTGTAVALSLVAEGLAGVVALGAVAWILEAARRTAGQRPGQRPGGPAPADAGPEEPPGADGTPPGAQPAVMRIGVDMQGRPVDLILDGEASLFLVGLPGSGKTNTLMVLMAEALRCGWPVIAIDLKGSGSMRRAVHVLAGRHGVPAAIFDRADPASLGYDPCAGTPAEVSNRLVGAFSFAGAANVFQQVALDALPQVINALAAAERPITLASIVDAFNHKALSELGRAAGTRDGVDYQAELKALEDSASAARVIQEGHVGLQKRLGALRRGAFGPLLERRPALDWHASLAHVSLTYFALSTLGTSADVELLGRVVIQHLKQEVDARLRSADPLLPALVLIDEFAALNEPEQLVDLILQAREANLRIVISTQFIPKALAVRKALLGAGIIIAHRVEGDDAEVLAAQFGTVDGIGVTTGIDYRTGEATHGTLRREHTYRISPEVLRNLETGQAALRVARATGARQHRIIRVRREEV